MTTIKSIIETNEFYNYPNLINLIDDTKQNPENDVTLDQQKITTLSTKNVLDRKWSRACNWIDVQIKTIWHRIWLLCSENYREKFNAAALKIINAEQTFRTAEEVRLRAEKIAELQASLETDEKKLQALETQKTETEESISTLEEELRELPVLQEEKKNIEKKLFDLNQNILNIVFGTKKSLNAKLDKINNRIEKISPKSSQTDSNTEVFDLPTQIASNKLILTTLEGEIKTLQEKIAADQATLTELTGIATVAAVPAGNTADGVLPVVDDSIEEPSLLDIVDCDGTYQNYSSESTKDQILTNSSSAYYEEAGIAADQATLDELTGIATEKKADKLIRLINTGTRNQKLANLFQVLFNKFSDLEENIRSIDENKNEITINLNREWQIWSPSDNTNIKGGGVIILINKIVRLKLSKNEVEVVSDKRSLHGLQTKLSAIWPYDKTNVNVKKIKYTKHNIEMTAIFMGERKEIKPFKEFYDIWKDKCIVVPKADQHLYPAEISVDKRAQWNITDTQEQA